LSLQTDLWRVGRSALPRLWRSGSLVQMSVHNAEFEDQAVRALKESQNAAREAERATNPFRLADAGVLWLIWLPILVLVIGIALILGEANYQFLKAVFIPKPTMSDSFELPTI